MTVIHHVFFSFLISRLLSCQQDIINKKRCELDPKPGCTALEHIAPIYFAIFVLATQFVLLNVVVAVLMKHLEEAKEEDSMNSSRDGTDTVLAMQLDGNTGLDTMQGHSSKDGYPGGSGSKTESNNNAMVVIPVVGLVHRSNDSDSSLSSFEQTVQPVRASRNLRQRLPPVGQVQPERSMSLATLRLPPIGSQSSGLNIGGRSAKNDDSSISGFSSPENEKAAKKRMDGQISPRAPIYVMSEDSDLNDSNVEVDHDHSVVFRPVDRDAKSKGSVRSPSPQSSSEDEGKKKKFYFKKPSHKSESTKGKAFKKEPKSTSIVSPESKPVKQGAKPVKPEARWASPVLGVNQGKVEMKLHGTKAKTDNVDQGTSHQMQSYV